MDHSHKALADLLHSAFRYAHALCSHFELAEDLVHEAWLRVVETHGPEPDRGLLFRVIRNLYIDEFRHRRRFPKDTLDKHEHMIFSSDDPSNYASEDLQLSEGLSKLRDEEREALFLWVFEGHTAAEIATLTDKPRGSVLSLIHRAKGKLKTYMESAQNPSLSVLRNQGDAQNE